MVRGVALAAALASLVALAPPYAAPVNAAAARLPPLMLWAWERPEDLRGLDRDVGVAFLAQSITLDGGRVRIRPRMQPLRVDPATALVAVTRIDGDAAEAGPVADAIARTATLPQVAGVQVDFDAVSSQREFYRGLLAAVRMRLPRDTALSITALASWCADDRWLGGAAIDEAVPMLFRMGPFNEPYARLAESRTGSVAACRGAIGLSLDEPRPIEASGRRVYVFSPKPWTARSIADARREARR
jgi:hypothetical protein